MPTTPSAIMVFIAGLATVVTPCVLPILPAILSGSVGSRLRPIAIVTGMSITFTLMGILISAVASFGYVTDYLRWFSIFFIIGMGAVLFDDDINNEYVKITSSTMNFARQNLPFLGNLEAKVPQGGLFGGLFLGMSLGIIWIPCVGPILGAVLAFVAESSAGSGSLLYPASLLVVYSMGVSIPMLIIAYSGKKVSGHVSWFVKRGHFFKKLSGLMLILVGLMLLFGVDKYLQAKLLPYFPPLI
ncbi:MAG: cytochrome c biogenesis protein CcdA [Candidatus Methanoperedenaceae archaeon]|nr:cytochrome c biogenesis protein CcdA [Candidatus Methanoperedenaceae archaeon]